MPGGSIIASMYFSRSGNWMADLDRGDLGKWILGSQNVSILLKKVGGMTTEDILEKAKADGVEPKALFAKYVHNAQPTITLEQAGALYDVYIKPPGVPPEFYWGRLIGLRYIPVYTYEQAAREVWNKLNWEAAKKLK